MQNEQQLGDRIQSTDPERRTRPGRGRVALVTAPAVYEESRIEVRRATGSILKDYGISIASAKNGVVEASHP